MTARRSDMDGTNPPRQADRAACLENDPLRRRTLEHRVLQKIEDSEALAFDTDEQRLFTVFFELASEYDARRDLLTVSVMLPRIFFGENCRLYLRNGPRAWSLARCLDMPATMPVDEPPAKPAAIGSSLFLPILGRPDTAEMLGHELPGGILGWLEVEHGADICAHRQTFYENFARRIGYQLHNRVVRAKNKEHLAFIQNLVADIGHNVIVPNMVFKLFFNRLNGSVQGLEKMVEEAPEGTSPAFLAGLDFLHSRLRSQYEEIIRHYEQTSLFLETLLRRRHFEEGRYVLEKRMVNLRKQVVDPQVARYRPRLHDKGVSIDLSMGGIPDLPIYLMADLGLISQVYANLFSNAVKYTQAVSQPDGSTRKFMAYGLEVLHNAFGPAKPGVKLNVFTTGPVIAEGDRAGLFTPGYRCAATSAEHGTGHGLAFVRQVVELHGGLFGHEAQPLGNNFYIILPLET